jgi:eukaryotic-like serine/threonine-protein kinase
MTANMLQIGDQFDRYTIQGIIAHGGMSDIYRAYDLVGRQEVALKIPEATMIGDPAQYERFQREKDVLSTLQHPAVLRGLGTGQFNRIPYLATELVDGQNLRDWIDAKAPVDIDTAVNLMIKIADGMLYCHANSVIHRDLKPENILIKNDGQPIIMDFGLALTKGAHRVTYSNLSATMGTPEYMAPEQVEGKRGDERTDLYALATILFEMLAGKPPFTGDTPIIAMQLRMQQPAPRLDRIRPDIPKSIAAVIARALQRSPEDRYPGVRDWIVDLTLAITQPDAVDLSVLEAASLAVTPPPWWKSQYAVAVLIAFGILFGLAGLAIGLAALR